MIMLCNDNGNLLYGFDVNSIKMIEQINLEKKQMFLSIITIVLGKNNMNMAIRIDWIKIA